MLSPFKSSFFFPKIHSLDLYDVVRVKASTGRAAGDYDYVLMPKQDTSQAPMTAPVTPQVTDSINFDVNTGL